MTGKRVGLLEREGYGARVMEGNRPAASQQDDVNVMYEEPLYSVSPEGKCVIFRYTRSGDPSSEEEDFIEVGYDTSEDSTPFRCLKCTGCNEEDICLRTRAPPPPWIGKEDPPASVWDEWFGVENNIEEDDQGWEKLLFQLWAMGFTIEQAKEILTFVTEEDS